MWQVNVQLSPQRPHSDRGNNIDFKLWLQALWPDLDRVPELWYFSGIYLKSSYHTLCYKQTPFWHCLDCVKTDIQTNNLLKCDPVDFIPEF